jgi:deoxyribonuclease-4
MGVEQAREYRALAAEYNISLSMHAPYYISLSSLRKDVVARSKEEIKKAFSLAGELGVSRIIFHPGGGYGTDREKGLAQIIEALNSIKDELDTENIKIYPEIGGKVNQLGTLDEIIEICKKVSYARPCIDLAHLHARERGSLDSPEKIVAVFKKIEKDLGEEMLAATHIHMYPVDFTQQGEKVHKTFGEKLSGDQTSLFAEDQEYGPRAEDYIVAIKELGLTPMTICEAHNTQDVGAMLMKKLYFEGGSHERKRKDA